MISRMRQQWRRCWHRSRLAARLLPALLPLPLGAQDAAPAVLRLGDLYRALDVASPVVVAAATAGRAAEARVPAASRLPDPHVQLQFMNRNLPRLGLDDPLGMNQIQVTQSVPIAGRLGLSGGVARAAADAAQSRRREVQRQQRTQAAAAFYDLYAAETHIDVTRETLALLEDLVSTLLTMYGVGEARQADVLRAQLEVGRMTADLEEKTALRRRMVARINALLNRPVATPVGRPELPVFPGELPALDSLVRLAEAGRPMIEAGRWAVTEAELLVTKARREIWPDLEVGVIYGQRLMPDGATNRMVSFMVGANVPIWAGSRQLRMRDEAEATRQMAEAELETALTETRGSVAERLSDLERARHLTRLYRNTLLPQAQAMVASARAAYQVGEVDFMTLLDAVMLVNRYRETMHELEAAEGQALADLEMLADRSFVAGIPDHPDLRTGGIP